MGMGMGMGMGVQEEPGGVNQALYETQPGENGEVGLQREPGLAEEGSSEEEEVGDVMVIMMVVVIVVVVGRRAEAVDEEEGKEEEEEEGAEDEGRFCVTLMGLEKRIRHNLMKGRKLRRRGVHFEGGGGRSC